ncbi:MAG TPA: zf-TFIIB domain-containing protein [Lapillicoccus sp.]|jgi:Zn-finger nucleic acid-binding protein|nr:zf-TFIIB domain-containing protein [Lapillicoccus sp.]
MTTTLTCPKCASDMRSYERNRVLVDQCTGCGGLFLDRGELEKLVAAENEWHGAPAAAAPAPPPQDRSYAGPQDRGYQQGYDQHSDHRYDNRNDNRYDNRYDQRGYQQRPYPKKKKSFLSELFDD